MPIPVAQAGPKQYANYSTLPRLNTLTGTATNAPILEWEWRMLSVPNGSTANIGVNGDFTAGVYTSLLPVLPPAQFTSDVQGSYVLQLRARNATGWSDPFVDKAIGQTIIVIRTQKVSLTIPSSYEYDYGQPDLNAALLAIETALGGPLVDLQQAYDNNPTANPAILFTDKGFVVQDANPTIGANEILLGAKGPAGTDTYFGVKGDGKTYLERKNLLTTPIEVLVLDNPTPATGPAPLQVSPAVMWKGHSFQGGADRVHAWRAWARPFGTIPVNSEMVFDISYDGSPVETVFGFGVQDADPKGLIFGPNHSTILTLPEAAAGDSGFDLHVQAGKKGLGGAADGILMFGDSGTSAIYLGTSGVYAKVPDGGAIQFLSPGSPFSIFEYDTIFSGTRDDTCAWAYNVTPNTGGTPIDASEPMWSWSLEAHYNDGAAHWVESNLQYVGAGGAPQRRPITTAVNRTTHEANVGLWGRWVYLGNDAGSSLVTLDSTALQLQVQPGITLGWVDGAGVCDTWLTRSGVGYLSAQKTGGAGADLGLGNILFNGTSYLRAGYSTDLLSTFLGFNAKWDTTHSRYEHDSLGALAAVVPSSTGIWFYANTSQAADTAASVKMRLDTTGFLALGMSTTVPPNLLTLGRTGSLSASPGIDFYGTISAGDPNTQYNQGRIYGIFDGTGWTDARLTLCSSTGAGTFANVLSIKNGRVGIGTGATTPDTMLHIQGATNASVGIKLYETGQNYWTWTIPASATRLELADVNGIYLTLNSGGLIQVYNQTATTGVTTLKVQAGAGQSTTELLGVYANNGTTNLMSVGGTGLSSHTVSGTATADTQILSLTNSGNAASMTNTRTSILFNQWYYDAGTPAVADAASITVGTEGNWTSTASTQDAYMAFSTAVNGTVAEKARLTSGGLFGIGTTSPGKRLHVVSTSQVDGVMAMTYSAVAATDRSIMWVGRSRGTEGSPSAILSGDYIGGFNFVGQFDGTPGNLNSGAVLLATAAGNWTGLSTPANFVFQTVPIGSVLLADRAIITSEGFFGVNASDPQGRIEVRDTSFPPLQGTRMSGDTNTFLGGISVQHRTTADMIDGFGTGVVFTIWDSAAASNPIGMVGSKRAGADNTGDLYLISYAAGVQVNAIIAKSTGNVGIGVSPSYRLDVNSGAATEVARFGNSSGGPSLYVMGDAGGVAFSSAADYAHAYCYMTATGLLFDAATSVSFAAAGTTHLRLTATETTVTYAGTVKTNKDPFVLTNSGNAADMDGTATSILFRQYYYDAATPAAVDAARITVGTETDWTSTASTQDAYMAFSTAVNGTVTEWGRFVSSGWLSLNPSTTPQTALLLDIAALTGDGTRDSHYIQWTGRGYESSTPHTADWQAFVDVTANEADSTFTIRQRLDGGSWNTLLTLADDGNLTTNYLTSGVTTLNAGTSPITTLLLDIAALTGDGTRDSHSISWKAHDYSSAADHAHVWTAHVEIPSATAINSLWTLDLAYDGAAAFDVLQVGGQNSDPKGQLKLGEALGNWLISPTTRSTAAAGRDLIVSGGVGGVSDQNGGNFYARGGAKDGTGVDGSVYIGDSVCSGVYLGSASCEVYVVNDLVFNPRDTLVKVNQRLDAGVGYKLQLRGGKGKTTSAGGSVEIDGGPEDGSGGSGGVVIGQTNVGAINIGAAASTLGFFATTAIARNSSPFTLNSGDKAYDLPASPSFDAAGLKAVADCLRQLLDYFGDVAGNGLVNVTA